LPQREATLTVARRIARVVGVDVDDVERVRLAVERPVQVDGVRGVGHGRDEDGEVLRPVRAGVGVARIVAAHPVGAEVDREPLVPDSVLFWTRLSIDCGMYPYSFACPTGIEIPAPPLATITLPRLTVSPPIV